MGFADFHNRMRVLLNIDMHDFVAAGIEPARWEAFRDDPHRFFIRADDETAEKLWSLVEARATRRFHQERDQ